MRLFVVVGLVVGGSMLTPMAAWAGDAGGEAAGDSDIDPSLSQKAAGCQWRVPAKIAPLAKKGRHKPAVATVPHVLFAGVPCKNVKAITLRADGLKAALTSASEGAPESVPTGGGTFALAYPLTYRMFEADLVTGKVAEFGLPKFEFPNDVRPAAAVGYNRRDALVIVATGLKKTENTSMLQRFSPSRQGWSVLSPIDYQTDIEQDPRGLCGDNFLIHAIFTKDLDNWCVRRP